MAIISVKTSVSINPTFQDIARPRTTALGVFKHGDREFLRVHAGRGPSTGCGAGRGVVEI